MSGLIPETKISRYRAFWQRAETDRALVGTTISTFPSVRAIRGEGILQPESIDIAEHLREQDEEWEQWREASGDAIWTALPLWAFPWHLAIAGSPVRLDGGNLWGLPALDDWTQLERVHFDPTNPWYLKYRQILLALVEHAAGRYPVGLGPLLYAPPDGAMQLRGQDRLAMDFYDAPERVELLIERLTALVADATDALYALTPSYGGGYAGSSRYFWAPGQLVEGAEDVTFMTSPELHWRFVVPAHRALGRRFSHYFVHLHSAQLHTVANLLEVEEIAALEVTPDYGEDLRPYLPLFGQILERKPLLLHGVISIESARELLRALPSRGLALFCRCNSPEEARTVLRALL